MKADCGMKAVFAAVVSAMTTAAGGCFGREPVTYIVRDGKPAVCVEMPSGSSSAVSNAVDALVKWTREKTGATLPVVGSGSSSRLPAVTFRRTEKGEGFSGDGFSVAVSGDGISVCVTDEAAFSYAVHYVLGRFAGIDWFHPESGADFTESPSFSVPRGTIVRNPPARRSGNVPGNPVGDRKAKVKLVDEWNVRNGFRPGRNRMGGHIIGNWLLWTPVDETVLAREIEAIRTDWTGVFKSRPGVGSAETYARWKILSAKHPEWFARPDGKPIACGQELIGNGSYGYLGRSAMPCLSNPEVRRRMLENFIKRRNSLWFAKWKSLDFDIICDDQPHWCECKECAKLVKPGASGGDKASDYYWDFVNWIAPRMLKADPTVTVNAYAYQSHRAFPKRVKPVPLGDRLNVVVCTHGRCYLHPLTNAACKANVPVRKMIEEWTEAGFPVVTFEYMCQTPGMCNYFPWERSWVADLKWYASKGVSCGAGGLIGPWFGFFKTPYFDQNGAKARWQLAYLTGRFCWDPHDDFDAVRDAAFAKYYRSAAKEMTEYRRYLEEKTMDAGLCMGYSDTEHGAHDLFAQGVAGRPHVLEPARRLLAAAKKAAAGDEIALGRIAMDERYFEKEWGGAAPLAESTDRFGSIRRLDDLRHGENYIMVGGLKGYPANAKALRVTFVAKGRADCRFDFKFGRNVEKPVRLSVDSPTEFRKHVFELPVTVRPRTFLLFLTEWLEIERITVNAVM